VKILDGIDIVSPEGTRRGIKIHAADTNIANIFSFATEEGSLQEFRKNKQSAILSTSKAEEFFGTSRASGQKIKVVSTGDTLAFVVAAVYRDFPKNSHEEFGFVIHFDTSSLRSLHFDPANSGVYGKALTSLPDGIQPLKAGNASSDDITYLIQPLSDIYFGPRVMGEDTRHGDHYSILILISITVLILFLALTTFINLSTLTLPHRAKEIAVKKLAGISQPQLMFGFARESLLIVSLSSALGLLILLLTSELFETILSIQVLSLLTSADPRLILIWAFFFVLFAVAPVVMVLKFTRATPGQLLGTNSISFPKLKRIIIFLQLGISVFLIVASMVIRRQINYSLLKEPGRNHDQVVYLKFPADMTDEGLRNLRKAWKEHHPNVIDIMATSQLPNQVSSKELNSPFYFMSVDLAFRDFFQLNILEGNWFKANEGDTVFVVNRRGKAIAGDRTDVIGVFEDMGDRFNQPEKPLKVNVTPYYNFNYLCIRILEVDIRRTVDFLSNYFSGGSNSRPTISFMDKNFEKWLRYQDGLNALSGLLAIISGLLSCFAIYGLSLSIVRDKLKEIALHKLFGASTWNITRLLVRGFARQVLVAVLVFGMLSYIILSELLRSFVYATSFQVLDALIPLLYCGAVIFMLCGFQARGLNKQDLSSTLKA
jgi:putative ABC transport system permease protein